MKNKILYLSVLLILTSCGASKKTSSGTGSTPIYVPQKETPAESKDGDKIDPKDSKKEESKKEQKEEDKTISTPDKKSKDSYNLAVLLPLMTDKVPLNYTPFQIDTDIHLSDEMQESLDFYMGLKLAVDDFKNKGKKVNVFVLDDANSTFQTKKILAERPFPEIDVIITANNQNVSKEIIDFSSNNKIPVFSTNSVQKVNSEYYHTVFPNIYHQLEQLVVKVQGNYPEAPVYIVPDAGEENITNTTNELMDFIKNQLNVTAKVIRDQSVTINETGETTSFIPDPSSTIVIVLSNREGFIKSTLSKIYQTTFPTYILGLPSWSALKNLENETQANPTIYIPSVNLTSKPKAEKEQFSSRYIEEFQMNENLNSLMGYDLMMYVMTLTDKDKLSEKPTSIQLGMKPYTYNFEFLPVYNSKGIAYFTNSQVGFLQYSKGKFIPFK